MELKDLIMTVFNQKSKLNIEYIDTGPLISLSNAWLAGYIAGRGEFNIYAYDVNSDNVTNLGFDLTFSDIALDSCFELQKAFPSMGDQSEVL